MLPSKKVNFEPWFRQSLYRVLPDTWDWTRMHTLVVMHRQTLYENVDSAKIKVPFYITVRYRYFTCGIDASYRHTLYWYIDPYRWIITPLVLITFSTDWGKTAVDWLRMPYFSVMMSEYCRKIQFFLFTLNRGVKAKKKIFWLKIFPRPNPIPQPYDCSHTHSLRATFFFL